MICTSQSKVPLPRADQMHEVTFLDLELGCLDGRTVKVEATVLDTHPCDCPPGNPDCPCHPLNSCRSPRQRIVEG